MTAGEYREDLVVLTADKDMEFTLRGVLGRPEALGIKQIRLRYIDILKETPVVSLKGMISFVLS